MICASVLQSYARVGGKALDNSESIRVMFIDAKAFDYIGHSTFVRKLYNVSK